MTDPPPPDVTVAEMFVCLAIPIPMGHCIWDKLTGYWATTNQFHTRFYRSAMKRDRYVHILRFLHFQRKHSWAWHDGRQFWQVVEDAKSVLNSKQDIFKTLESLWTSDCRRSYCFVKRKGHFPTIHTQETNVLATKFTNHMTSLDTRMIWVYPFLDGGEKISYTDSRFILVNDTMGKTAQVGRLE
jgi:hypothetical protein